MELDGAGVVVTGAAAGIGERVRGSTEQGSIMLPVQLAAEMVPGVVWLPR